MFSSLWTIYPCLSLRLPTERYGIVTSAAFLEVDAHSAVPNSRLALFSVGGGNPEGNPAPMVLARLVGRDVLRTDQHGAVTVETDGTQMWV